MSLSNAGTSEAIESFDNSSSISESIKDKPRRNRSKSRSKRRTRERGCYFRPRMNAPANTNTFLIQDAMKANLGMVLTGESKQSYLYKAQKIEKYLEERERNLDENSQLYGDLELEDHSDVSQNLELEELPDYPDEKDRLEVEDQTDESDYESKDSFLKEEALKHQKRISELTTDKIREDCCNLEVECIELQSHIEVEEKVKNILCKIQDLVNNGVDLARLDTLDEPL